MPINTEIDVVYHQNFNTPRTRKCQGSETIATRSKPIRRPTRAYRITSIADESTVARSITASTFVSFVRKRKIRREWIKNKSGEKESDRNRSRSKHDATPNGTVGHAHFPLAPPPLAWRMIAKPVPQVSVSRNFARELDNLFTFC